MRFFNRIGQAAYARDLTEDEARLVLRVATVLAIPLALVVLIPSMLAIGLVLREGRERIADLDRSRAEIIHSDCLDQNERNTATLRELDRRLELAISDNPERAASARASRDFTVALIDALAPHRDCAALVRELFDIVPESKGSPDG